MRGRNSRSGIRHHWRPGSTTATPRPHYFGYLPTAARFASPRSTFDSVSPGDSITCSWPNGMRGTYWCWWYPKDPWVTAFPDYYYYSDAGFASGVGTDRDQCSCDRERGTRQRDPDQHFRWPAGVGSIPAGPDYCRRKIVSGCFLGGCE